MNYQQKGLEFKGFYNSDAGHRLAGLNSENDFDKSSRGLLMHNFKVDVKQVKFHVIDNRRYPRLADSYTLAAGNI